MSQYVYDNNEFRFKKARTSVWAVIRKILVFFVVTLALAFLYYVLFALVFSTDTEQRLKDENRMYSIEYPELAQKEELLSDVIRGLQVKDDKIYEEIFHASAPNMEPMSSGLPDGLGFDSGQGYRKPCGAKARYGRGCGGQGRGEFPQGNCGSEGLGFRDAAYA